MTKVKICGIQTRAAYHKLCELEVDYVGFVFAKSKRQVTAEQVQELAGQACGDAAFPVAEVTNSTGQKDRLQPEHLKQRIPQRVGVFVNESLDELLRIAEVAQLDVLQLHGDETPAFCQELRTRSGRAIWKAWGVQQDARDAALAAYTDVVDAFVLDNERGGTGESFPWSAIPTLRTYVKNRPLWIAGGLHPDNVGILLAEHTTDGVDVSSGVETEGVKDLAKITAFVSKVRGSR